MHGIYLHGFGSGPLTAKGTALGQRLAGVLSTWTIPDLEGGDFTGLTMDAILARAEAALQALPADGAPVLLVGSSLGGYTAALLAAQGRAHRVGGILLIAPAFGFTTHWTAQLGAAGVAAWRRTGSRPFFHFGAQREVPLGVGFYESCLLLPELPGPAVQPVSVVHGRQDATVDHRVSLAYARECEGVELHLVNGDHRLTEPRHEELIAWAAHDLLQRMALAGQPG
jgi:uncharacterized protein